MRLLLGEIRRDAGGPHHGVPSMRRVAARPCQLGMNECRIK